MPLSDDQYMEALSDLFGHVPNAHEINALIAFLDGEQVVPRMRKFDLVTTLSMIVMIASTIMATLKLFFVL